VDVLVPELLYYQILFAPIPKVNPLIGEVGYLYHLVNAYIAIPFYLCQKSYRFLGIGNRQWVIGKSFGVYF